MNTPLSYTRSALKKVNTVRPHISGKVLLIPQVVKRSSVTRHSGHLELFYLQNILFTAESLTRLTEPVPSVPLMVLLEGLQVKRFQGVLVRYTCIPQWTGG